MTLLELTEFVRVKLKLQTGQALRLRYAPDPNDFPIDILDNDGTYSISNLTIRETLNLSL